MSASRETGATVAKRGACRWACEGHAYGLKARGHGGIPGCSVRARPDVELFAHDECGSPVECLSSEAICSATETSVHPACSARRRWEMAGVSVAMPGGRKCR